MKTTRITLLLEALSPITHQRGTVGNESLVNAEPVQTPLGIVNVPFLSGNALRKMLRVHWADSCRFENLTKRELALLYGGGNERSKGGQPSLKVREEIASLLPGLAVLGCSTADDIIPGTLQFDRGMLICRENANRLQSLYPALSGDEWRHVAPASQFVSRWQYYRHEPLLGKFAPVEDGEADGNSSMPFGGTCVIPGAAFLSEIRITPARDIDIGCVLDSLTGWQHSGGVIGGQGARGHGRLKCSVLTDVEQQPCIDAFHAHSRENRGKARELLKRVAT